MEYCNAPYLVYSQNAAFDLCYSQVPSPPSSATSGSQYSSSPSPQDYHNYQQTYAVQQITYPIQPNPIQVPQLPSQTLFSYPSPPLPDPTIVSAARGSKPRQTKTSVSSKTPMKIPHPYARLFAKKDEIKRRKIWNHALEKSIFTPYELSTLGAPQRRAIYIASLEAHIDRLHARLLELDLWPVNFSELEPFKGLNSKTAKSMVAGLQHDSSVSKLKLLELERANGDLAKALSNCP